MNYELGSANYELGNANYEWGMSNCEFTNVELLKYPE